MDSEKWNEAVKAEFMESISNLWDDTYVTETFSDNPETPFA
jgi:hypothetical protein